MDETWREKMREAKEKCDAAGFTAEMDGKRRNRYQVDFSISPELVSVEGFEAFREEGGGTRIRISFTGTDEARRRVLEVVEKLPSVRRTYRMSYEEEVS